MGGSEVTVEQATAARKAEADRRLRNFRSVVHRKGTTGWVDRSAAPQFRRAFEAVVAFEDLAGIEAAGKVADRLREVRVEAMARGLLTATQVCEIEREVIGVGEVYVGGAVEGFVRDGRG